MFQNQTYKANKRKNVCPCRENVFNVFIYARSQLIYFIDKEYGIVIGIGLFDDNKLETFKTEHLSKVFDSAWGEIVCTVIDQFGLIRDFFSNSNKSEIL